jgi:cytoskeletal protein CcmA (bactofilin family)
MKNPFKRTGFDTLISKGTKIDGALFVEANATTIIDGMLVGPLISQHSTESGSTLVINGDVNVTGDVHVENVTITGTLNCRTLEVNGQLAVKNGAIVFAEFIKYRSLVVEPAAKLNGQMVHLDTEARVKIAEEVMSEVTSNA